MNGHKPNNIAANFLLLGVVLFFIAGVAFIASIWGTLKSFWVPIIGGVYWIISGISSMTGEKQVLIYAIIGMLLCFIGYWFLKPPTIKQRRF
jgi:hypothetical protein